MSLAFDEIPELVEGLDAKTLPLSAVEGFVLSRVDGVSTAKEIADSTGIGEELALTALSRLVGLGAIRARPAPAKPAASPAPAASTPVTDEQPNKRFGRPKSVAPQRVHTIPPPAGTPRRLYDPQELEEEVALDDTRKRRVLDVFYKLGTADHYDLLEVGRDATKDEIRDSYFALSKEFHPDTAFGKDLGSYKAKMEKIFTAATAAYDVLSRKARRAQYDATLPPPTPEDLQWRERRGSQPGAAASGAKRTAEPAHSPLTTPKVQQAATVEVPPAAASKPTVSTTVTAPPVAPRPTTPSDVRSTVLGHAPARRAVAPPTPGGQHSVTQPSMAPATRPSGSAESPTSGAGVVLPVPSTLPEPPSAPRAPSPPSADQMKRSQDLLKMRLMGGRRITTGADLPNPLSARTTTVSQAPVARNPEVTRGDVLRGLAGSLRDASMVTGSGQLRRHLVAAGEAEASGDIKGALGALKLAAGLAPDDATVLGHIQRLEGLRSVEEAPMFEKRALAEEKAGQWSQAALSWLRVVEGRPNDINAARSCANALLEANLDLKKARDLALRVVAVEPERVSSRTLLARIYVAAGMASSARRELDAATKLDPENEIVKNLLRELG
ncbi:MAG: DnaJ domain-containing protein [Polyangiales bacterium]|nr:DnaJ domain-containing protein [Myxococcales bacterium]MCB9661315.1 DnaJ domain-containing protein [Sandaracinaceae bacterium]